MILRRCALCDEPCLPGLSICVWHRNEGAGQPRTPETTPGSEGGTGADRVGPGAEPDPLCEDCACALSGHSRASGGCVYCGCKVFIPRGPKS